LDIALIGCAYRACAATVLSGNLSGTGNFSQFGRGFNATDAS
jgi:hypothetical protein